MMKNKLVILTAGLIFITTTGFVSAMDSTSSATTHTNTTDTSNIHVTTSTSGKDSTSTTSGGTFFNLDEINNLFKEASNSANRSAQQLSHIIKAADEMISNRITSLNALSTRVQGDTRLSADEKASLTTQVQSAITGLTTLKTTIDADTDVTKAKSDTKLIVTNYYVYAVLEPKIRMFVTLNNLQTTSTNIAALVPKVQDLINLLGSQGKDVSGLNTLLTDVTTQLTTINTTISADIDKLNALTATSTNTQDVFTGVKNDLNTIVKTDYAKVKDDFSQMRTLFHQIISGNSGSPAPSATPIATP